MTMKLGTAAWADATDVAQRLGYRDGALWLGRMPEGQAVGFRDDRHVCLVSGSRGGKGTSAIINNLCLWPGSAVVIDPKGENATVTAARRGAGSDHAEAMGQTVHVLDPFGAANVDERYRSRFNPLDALDPETEQCVDEAARLADALVVVHEDSKDPFWDESARALVKGLILHVLTAEEFEGRRNLVTLRLLITRGDWEGVEVLREAGEDAAPHGLLWTGVSRNQALGGIVAGIGSTFLNMLLNSPKQFESVLQVANRNTEFLDSPGLQRCVSASDFKLSDLKTQANGVTLYLSLPQRYMATHYRWLRMMIALIVTEMELVRGRPASGHPVLMVLDEFAGLRRMEVIEHAAAQIAGYGVKLWFVVQSLEQLKAVYKENWETFLANSGLKMFFGIEDHFSREYISKLIGETELVREVRSDTDTLTESDSQSETLGTSESRSHSVSAGTSETSSSGGLFGPVTDSTGRSRGWSRTNTQGTSRSVGTTHGTSRGRTSGVSETLHRRALLSPDEIGQRLARIDDRAHPGYPGFALVLIAGQRPVIVRRANYFDDYEFLGRFDPHPDHAPRALARSAVSTEGLRPYLTYWPSLRVQPRGEAGRAVLAGEAIADVFVGQTSGAALLAPSAGRIVALREVDGVRDLPDQLAELLHYDGEPQGDPFAQIESWCRATQATLAPQLRRTVHGMAIAAALLLIPAANLFGSRNIWVMGALGAGLLVSGARVRRLIAVMARHPFGFSLTQTLMPPAAEAGRAAQSAPLWRRIDRMLSAATGPQTAQKRKALAGLGAAILFYAAIWQMTSPSPDEDTPPPAVPQDAATPVSSLVAATPPAMPGDTGVPSSPISTLDTTAVAPPVTAPDLDSLHELCTAIIGENFRNAQFTRREIDRSFAYDASRGLGCSLALYLPDGTPQMRTIAVFDASDPAGPGAQAYIEQREAARTQADGADSVQTELALPPGAPGYRQDAASAAEASAPPDGNAMHAHCRAIAGESYRNVEFIHRSIDRGFAFDAARGQGCSFSIFLPDGTESLRAIAIFDMSDPNGPGAQDYARQRDAARARVAGQGGSQQDGGR